MWHFIMLSASFRQKLGLGCQDHFREGVENMLVVGTTGLVVDLDQWQDLHGADLHRVVFLPVGLEELEVAFHRSGQLA